MNLAPPPILYHYTSQAGLLGIIESKCIWATEIHYLNDSSEFQYFFDLVNEVGDDLAEEIGRSKEGVSAGVVGRGIATLLSFSNVPGDIMKFPYFVTSFTAQGDLLSQWRAYSREDIGYSIGFSSSKLEQMARVNRFRLVECTYDADRHRRIIRNLFQTAVLAESAIKGYIENGRLTEDGAKSIGLLISSKELPRQTVISAHLTNPKSALDEVPLALAIGLLKSGQTFKNSAFSEEKEWRVVSNLTPLTMLMGNVRFRTGKHMIVPYVEFWLTDSAHRDMPIEEVIIGPSPHKRLSQASVEALLETRGISSKVKTSQIPYRPI